MIIRHSSKNDIPKMLEIYETARAFMRSTGNMEQWINGYPSKEVLESDIDKNGNSVSGSKKKKVISYINSLNLSIPQKAMLIKSQYSNFKQYDKQIFEYVNGQDMDFMSKATVLKKVGFTQFDNQIISYVKKHYPTITIQIDMLKSMGFKVYKYNGKTYVKR